LVEILLEAIKYADAKIRTEWCAKMRMNVNWSPEVFEKLLGLAICIGLINAFTERKENELTTALSLIKQSSGVKIESIKVFQNSSA
jgi:hypothetical protein